MLKDSLILWDVDQMFHTRLSDAVLEDLSALGIESLDRELTTRKECNAILETFAGTAISRLLSHHDRAEYPWWSWHAV